MQSFESSPQDFVASFALQRQRLLHHAGSLLGNDRVQSDPESLARLSQTLLTSLELLKVAEEELRDERRANATRQAAQDRRLAHLTSMFNRAPAALVLTTTDTTIREANLAAGTFFGRDGYRLQGSRLCEMVPRELQASFREQLGTALEMGAVAAWSFPIQLQRAGRIVATAAVSVIDDASVGTRALYWSLRNG